MYKDSRKVADKLIDTFSDNRVLPMQWKYMTTLFIVQGPLPTLINAKNFADGLQYHLDVQDVLLPDYQMAYESMNPNDWLVA